MLLLLTPYRIVLILQPFTRKSTRFLSWEGPDVPIYVPVTQVGKLDLQTDPLMVEVRLDPWKTYCNHKIH